MNRTLAVNLLVTPLATNAQPPGKVPRPGYLRDRPRPHAEAFRQDLCELAYLEGQNMAVEYR